MEANNPPHGPYRRPEGSVAGLLNGYASAAGPCFQHLSFDDLGSCWPGCSDDLLLRRDLVPNLTRAEAKI